VYYHVILSVSTMPTVHVLLGGRGNVQSNALSGAQIDLMTTFGNMLAFECPDTDTIRALHMTERDVVDWLLLGDIHLW
jgi:hypothetical protein